MQQIVQESFASASITGSGPDQQGVRSLLQALWEQSVSLVGRNAVNAALVAVPGAVQKLMALLQVRSGFQVSAALTCLPLHSLST